MIPSSDMFKCRFLCGYDITFFIVSGFRVGRFIFMFYFIIVLLKRRYGFCWSKEFFGKTENVRLSGV